MSAPETITSGQNPKIKTLLELQEKSKLRREMGLFVVEGRRELGHCLDAGFLPDTVFICPEVFDSSAEGIPPRGRATRGTEAGGPERNAVKRAVGSSEARRPSGVYPLRTWQMDKDCFGGRRTGGRADCKSAGTS